MSCSWLGIEKNLSKNWGKIWGKISGKLLEKLSKQNPSSLFGPMKNALLHWRNYIVGYQQEMVII